MKLQGDDNGKIPVVMGGLLCMQGKDEATGSDQPADFLFHSN